MKYDAVRMDFTMQELGYFLFAKKRCPRCGGRLRRHREHELRFGAEFRTSRDVFPADNAKVKYFFFRYACEECHADYRLSELAQWRG